MNVYEIEAIGCYHQKHCVVAESFAEAERLWEKEYHSAPKAIYLYSVYVIIQPQPKRRDK